MERISANESYKNYKKDPIYVMDTKGKRGKTGEKNERG